jgi:hypothetical protein
MGKKRNMATHTGIWQNSYQVALTSSILTSWYRMREGERELHQHVKLISVRSSAHFISLGALLELQTSSGYTCNKLPILLDILSFDETPCCTVKTWRFEETYCLYLPRRNVLWRPSLACSVMVDVTGWHKQKCRRYCFYPEDGGKSIPRNVGEFLLPDYTTHKPRWQPTSFYFFFPSSWYSSLPFFFSFSFFLLSQSAPYSTFPSSSVSYV